MSSDRIADGSKITSSGMSAADFFAEDGYRSAPLGGSNPYSADCTQVLNLPNCPSDCACGGKNTMVACWPPQSNIEYCRRQGILPIPVYAFLPEFNGGKPVTPVRNAKILRDGVMIGDPGTYEVVLCWTTCENDARLSKNDADACEALMNGRPARGISTQAATSGDDGELRKSGLIPEEESSYTKQGIERTGKGQFVAKDRRPMVTVPG